MDSTFFHDRAKEHFAFLMAEYGFTTKEETDDKGGEYQGIVFQSSKFLLGLNLERWTVTAYVAPIWSLDPSVGVDAGYLVAFLNRTPDGSTGDAFYPPTYRNLDYYTNLDSQLSELAPKIRPYISRFAEFLQKETYESQQKELEEFSARRNLDIIKRALSKGQSNLHDKDK